jgi:Tol biopolymer transport system component
MAAVVEIDREHHPHIVLKNSATGEVKELVRGSQPRWSPDGKWIACTVWRSPARFDVLSVIDVGTGEVLEPEARGSSDEYAWSPDGRSIAVVVNDQSSILLRLVEVPSGRSRTLATLPAPGGYTDLAWSPDSRTIVTTVATEPDHLTELTDLYMVDVDSASCRLTKTVGINESEPRWVDDRHILYEVETEDSGLSWRILTMEPRAKAK